MLRTFLHLLAGAATTLTLVHAALAATYYVAGEGDDQKDGLTPATAWASLERVNKGPFQPGDKILFRRGDVWRGQLIPHSGSAAGPVTYAAYGAGEKPLLLGPISKSKPEDWTKERGGPSSRPLRVCCVA